MDDNNYCSNYQSISKINNHPISNILLCFQATRLTAVGKGLCKLGLEISSRPFVYTETPDLELQMFLNFTDATRYNVSKDLLYIFVNISVGLSLHVYQVVGSDYIYTLVLF